MKKIKIKYTESEIRERIDTFDWLYGLNHSDTFISTDFYREFRDIIDWEKLCRYNYFIEEDFIKEFRDYLPKVYRDNYN